MSGKIVAGLIVMGAVAALLISIRYFDRLTRNRPGGHRRRTVQRVRDAREPVTDEDIERLLRRKPFLHGTGGESTTPSPLPRRYSREDYPDPL